MVRVAMLMVLAGLGAGCSRRGLSNEELSRVVDAQRGSLDACYNGALAKQPDKRNLDGKARILVAPSGEVAAVDIEGDLPLEGLEACLREAITDWQFPPAEAETRTTLPLLFRADVVRGPAR